MNQKGRPMDFLVPARVALLIELLNGPDSKTTLADRLRRRTKGKVDLLRGSIDPALAQLHEEHFVTRAETGTGHEYQLTPAGETVAQGYRGALVDLVV